MCYVLVSLWFGAFVAANAAANQLQALKDLEVFRKEDAEIADAVKGRLNNHLWFLSEEFVPTVLVSQKVDPAEKRDIAEALLSQPTDQLAPGLVRMPKLGSEPCLSECVGPQSLHFFKALSISTRFLIEPVETWSQNPDYQKFESFVAHLPVTNDESERMIRRTVIFANVGHKGETEFQGQLQIVGKTLAQIPKRDTKKGLINAYKRK